MWKIGPECAAQQAKCASASVMNCGVRSACADGPLRFRRSRLRRSLQVAAACGAGRTSNEAGISSAQATMPITSIAVRQS